jgi:hypothetical protein
MSCENEFSNKNKYYFSASASLVESIHTDPSLNKLLMPDNGSNQIYLGHFIEYIGWPYGFGDWLTDAKARFEFGIISKGQYHNVTVSNPEN